MAQFRLLSIDGGGIRGLIPALVLTHIERETKKPICELFDAIAGTSTGGILALGLTRPGGDLPERAQTLVELYRSRGREIFAEGFVRRAVHGVVDLLPSDGPNEHPFGLPRHVMPSDLWDPKYGAEGRAKVLQAFFGETPLTAAKTRLFVTSYDTYGRAPVFFVASAQDASSDDYHDAIADGVTMFDAAMATSAAPTYFPPHKVARPQGGIGEHGQTYFSLVDGGVFSNNPSGLAQSFLRAGASEPGDLVVSLGTGSMTAPYPFEQIEDWGAAQWGSPVLKMMFDGQTEAVALALHRRLGAKYVRLQAYLTGQLPTPVSDDLDDASPANLAAMEQFAKELIAKNRARLDALCDALADRPGNTQPPQTRTGAAVV